MDNPNFWDFLAKQNQEDFRNSGTAGSCIEARELIISLPEEFQKYDREQLLKLFVMKFKQEYGTDTIAALHHNKAMTNYHIHLIFSERKLLEHAEFKKASRNMFFDEHGRHVRTKKAIRESIEKTGFHPDLLSAILQAAIRALLDLIRAIPKKVHKEPVFDAEVFRRMQGVRKDLLHQNQVIAAARHRCERAQAFSAEASKPANIFKCNMKTKAAKELSASLLEYEKAIAEPDKIVKRAGYRSVAAFTKAYEKSCRLLEKVNMDEQKHVQMADETGSSRSVESRESVLAKLIRYEKAAQMQKREKPVSGRRARDQAVR